MWGVDYFEFPPILCYNLLKIQIIAQSEGTGTCMCVSPHISYTKSFHRHACNLRCEVYRNSYFEWYIIDEAVLESARFNASKCPEENICT
jgi:hypothetical protein